MYIKRENLRVTRQELKGLEDALPHGAKKKIAEHLDLHRNSVDKVFQGVWDNEEMIEAACTLIMGESLSTKKKRIMIAEVLREYAPNSLN